MYRILIGINRASITEEDHWGSQARLANIREQNLMIHQIS